MSGRSISGEENEHKRVEQYVEKVVCRDVDIGENEMKSFVLDDSTRVLVLKQNGRLHALGDKCTHYSGDLDKGVLGQGKVQCPLHGACFNISTGDIEDFPGLDSLPCHEVRIDKGEVVVRAKKSAMSSKRVKKMCGYEETNKNHIVVIGGGPSGATCVETLRQEGFTGQITMVAKESYLPYERVKVSKVMNIPTQEIQYRSEDFYKTFDITVLRNVEATRVNVKSQTIELSNNQTLQYSKVYVATGMSALRAPITGSSLENVFVLRDLNDSHAIQSQLESSKEVVVLGGSFLGMEVAAYCTGKVAKVTVISWRDLPLQKIFGLQIAQAICNTFIKQGVQFTTNCWITTIIGTTDGKISAVRMSTGEQITAHLLIMCCGGTYNTQFLQESGFKLEENGTIETDRYLQTSAKNVYAGGDIAHAPIFVSDDAKDSVTHIGVAQYHGRIAALNMLGIETPLCTVPFFWTSFFGKSLRYVGHGKYDDIVYVGSVTDLEFVAYFLYSDFVVAVVTCSKDPIAAQFAELRRNGKTLHRNDLGTNKLAWIQAMTNVYKR